MKYLIKLTSQPACNPAKTNTKVRTPTIAHQDLYVQHDLKYEIVLLG